MIPVKGMPGWAKDPKTGAVVNLDEKKLSDAQARKRQRLESEASKQNRIDKLEKELADIKALLLKNAASENH